MLVVVLGFGLVVTLGLIALCLRLVVLGLEIKDQVEPVTGWAQAAGWIASFQTYQGEQAPHYMPLIAFRADNRVVTFDAPTTGQPPVVGSKALVSYDPRNPADAHDLSAGSAWESRFYGGIIFLVAILTAQTFAARAMLRAKRRHGVSFSWSAAGGDGKHVRGSAR